MHEQKLEGIILQVAPFKEQDRILTVFSPEHGVVKLFLKGSKKSSTKTVLAPLTRAEFVYRIGASDLWQCQEAAPLELYLSLRESLERLEAACDLLRTIQKSQMAGKAAPELYALFVRYLEAMAAGQQASLLACSFRLKLLHHEGLFHIDENSLLWTEDEKIQIVHLTLCRSLKQLVSLPLSPELPEKVRRFFDVKIENQ